MMEKRHFVSKISFKLKIEKEKLVSFHRQSPLAFRLSINEVYINFVASK